MAGPCQNKGWRGKMGRKEGRDGPKWPKVRGERVRAENGGRSDERKGRDGPSRPVPE